MDGRGNDSTGPVQVLQSQYEQVIVRADPALQNVKVRSLP